MRVGDGHKDFRDFWTEVFDTVHAGRIDIWDYQWAYSCWLLDGITILPSRNLVKYIGYGSEATHTKGDGGWIGKLPLGSDGSFSAGASCRNKSVTGVADRWIDLNVFGVEVRQLISRILHRVLRRALGRSISCEGCGRGSDIYPMSLKNLIRKWCPPVLWTWARQVRRRGIVY